MSVAGLQKYLGSLGGVGTSGAGSSSSYSSKEPTTKEVMPAKVDVLSTYPFFFNLSLSIIFLVLGNNVVICFFRG